MNTTIKRLWNKYKDLIPYGIFGVLSTIVNVVAYALCAKIFGLSTVPSTVIAWFFAVLFAYVTNRKWVFHSEARGTKAILIEMGSFFACRILTGALDVGIMKLFVDILKFDDVIVKVGSNIVVIILNYVASKLVIFKKKNQRS